jgi:hypothetical protein
MLWLLLACSGKGSDDSSPIDDSSTAPGRRFAGTIVDASSGEPVPDADVCLYPENACVLSGNDGAFTIHSLREDDEEFLLLVSETAFVMLTVPFTVAPGADGPEDTFALWPLERLDAIADDVGTTADTEDLATLLVALVDGSGTGVAGRSVNLDPAKGEGPYYATDDDTFAAGTATTEEGEVLFLNVPENGSVKILVDGAPCTLDHSWVGLTDGTFRANLVAGRMFATRIRCD